MWKRYRAQVIQPSNMVWRRLFKGWFVQVRFPRKGAAGQATENLFSAAKKT